MNAQQLTLEVAQRLIGSALDYAREHSLKPLTVVILDTGGHVVTCARQDGASAKRFEIAQGKAHGAIAMGVGSRALMARAESQAYFIAALPLIPVPGGVLLYSNQGQLVGAIGITGDTSDADEAAAVAAASATGLHPVTG
jgi:uncharacterized protein GlcG (DUF336 family)